MGDPFQWMALSHLVMIGLLLVSVILLFSFRNKFSSKKDIMRYSLAFILLLSELSLYAWYTNIDGWDIVDTLPFQLCSITLFLSIIMLLTRSRFLFEITFFLGISGALQAMLTPELTYDFPHYRYFHFFIAHIAIILASFYMLWYENYRPTIKSVWKAFAALNVIALVVFFINNITGGNYMFLAEKPSNPSLLDLLGPYPWYLLSLEFVALGMFLFIYIPFTWNKQRENSKE